MRKLGKAPRSFLLMTSLGKQCGVPKNDEYMSGTIKLGRISCIDDNKYQTKAINSELVLNTWKGTLKDEELLPRNWLYTPEVLVGIEPLNHLPGRNR